MASILSAIVTETSDKRRYLQSVDIVASALALRFEYVALGLLCICGDTDGVLTLWCVVERVDGSKSVAYAIDVCSGRSRR